MENQQTTRYVIGKLNVKQICKKSDGKSESKIENQ